ncbi:MAG: NAD(P)H-dependent oxidoreductase [Proteobacteria bacterium]|nr:NAD(P)H-dependent oxidoreductase [Pseudomonadota bacterium]
MKKVLIINAHQRYEGFSEGKLNQSVVDFMKKEFEAKGDEVKLTNVEKGYDPAEEVEKHVWADLIITQSPVNWFGCPPIYAKYINDVLNVGLFEQKLIVDDGRTREDPSRQYGTGGKMQGKKYMLSLTWNAPEEAFGDKNQILTEGKTVDEMFIGNTVAYKFCGAEILPSFSCFNVMKEPHIEDDLARLKQILNSI